MKMLKTTIEAGSLCESSDILPLMYEHSGSGCLEFNPIDQRTRFHVLVICLGFGAALQRKRDQRSVECLAFAQEDKVQRIWRVVLCQKERNALITSRLYLKDTNDKA